MGSLSGVVSKVFIKRVVFELGFKRDNICKMERDEKDILGRRNCMNNSIEYKGRWCFWKIVGGRKKFFMGFFFLYV